MGGLKNPPVYWQRNLLVANPLKPALVCIVIVGPFFILSILQSQSSSATSLLARNKVYSSVHQNFWAALVSEAHIYLCTIH